MRQLLFIDFSFFLYILYFNSGCISSVFINFVISLLLNYHHHILLLLFAWPSKSAQFLLYSRLSECNNARILSTLCSTTQCTCACYAEYPSQQNFWSRYSLRTSPSSECVLCEWPLQPSPQPPPHTSTPCPFYPAEPLWFEDASLSFSLFPFYLWFNLKIALPQFIRTPQSVNGPVMEHIW